MSERVKYRGYAICRVAHPTPLNPKRLTWDICDGETVRKSNISSMDIAKHYIDVMIKYGYWQEKC